MYSNLKIKFFKEISNLENRKHFVSEAIFGHIFPVAEGLLFQNKIFRKEILDIQKVKKK